MLFDNRFPEDILVYIESVDAARGEIIFDFVDSNEFTSFTTILQDQTGLELPTMVLVRNYFGKRVQENTIYTLPRAVVQIIRDAEAISTYLRESNDPKASTGESLVIRYVITMPAGLGQMFQKAVSLNEEEKWFRRVFQDESGDLSLLPSALLRNAKAIVRDVGQGNWNEIWMEGRLVLIFDCGAPTRASANEVLAYIGSRLEAIVRDRPGIILSHWDVDHYHALAGLDNDTLRCISFFICRDHTPTLASRIIFGRIRSAIGGGAIVCIPAEKKLKGKVPLKLLSNIGYNILLFNAHVHKDRNRSGIVLVVRTGSKSIIFSADCHYYQLSDYVLPILDYRHEHYLVVPHHGGNAGKPEYNMRRQLPQRAIISVGVNSYGHPKARNVDFLKNLRFNVSQTRLLRQDIEIEIR